MDAFHLKIAVDEFTKTPLSEDEFYNRYSNSWFQSARRFIKKAWPAKGAKPYYRPQSQLKIEQ